MGWKQKSKGWIDAETPSRRVFNAKRRRNPRVRFNGLPYSAQRFPGGAISATTEKPDREASAPKEGELLYNRW